MRAYHGRMGVNVRDMNPEQRAEYRERKLKEDREKYALQMELRKIEMVVSKWYRDEQGCLTREIRCK